MIALLLLSGLLQAPSVADLDALAQKRDVASLTKFLTPESLKPLNPLQVLKTNGAYETGRMGWHVLELNVPDRTRSFVVFTTPITSEDVGEMVFERVGAALRYVPETNALGVAPVHHEFRLSFDVPAKIVHVQDKFKLRRSGPNESFYFLRMSPYLKVESIQAAGKSVPFVQAGGVTALPTFTGREAELELRYSGKVDLPNYAGSISANEIQLANDYWYPMIARQPAPYDLTVTTPKGWLAIGQGEKLSETETGQGRMTQYRMALPVVYYSFSAAPYRSASRQVGRFRISAWSMVRSDQQLNQQIDLYAPILEFYDRTFARFPFSGYGALLSQLYGGGALEAYSYATYGFGVPAEDAHEPSHTWWGGLINNTYLKSFWNESFAVYCEGLYARNVSIGNVKERSLAFIQDAEPQQSYLAATCEDASPWIGPAASGLGYGKGARVLQMLETELGTPTMIRCMQRWQQDQGKGEIGEWAGFERAVEETTHGNYRWFFDQWIRRKGWANFEVQKVQWRSGVLTGNLKFTGDPYRVSCELMLQYPDGHRDFTTFNTMQTGTGQDFSFSIPVKSKPSLVVVDPWRRILRVTKSDERPVELASLLERFRRFTDPKHKDWMKGEGGDELSALPADLSGVLIVGSPETLPAMNALCAKAGFVVNGNKLTYDGTTVDLNSGGALAIVDLPGGKRCAIGLGKTALEPNPGRARLALFDGYGRFLRGVTEPKTSGWMSFKLAGPGSRMLPSDHPIG